MWMRGERMVLLPGQWGCNIDRVSHKTTHTIWLITILSGIFPSELKSHAHTKASTKVFVAPSLIMVQTLKQPGCPSVGERTNWADSSFFFYLDCSLSSLGSLLFVYVGSMAKQCCQMVTRHVVAKFNLNSRRRLCNQGLPSYLSSVFIWVPSAHQFLCLARLCHSFPFFTLPCSTLSFWCCFDTEHC